MGARRRGAVHGPRDWRVRDRPQVTHDGDAAHHRREAALRIAPGRDHQIAAPHLVLGQGEHRLAFLDRLDNPERVERFGVHLRRVGRKDHELGQLAGVEDDSVLIEIEEGEIALPFAALSDAKLVLTDALIDASLRTQADKGFDPAAFDDIVEVDGEETDDTLAEDTRNRE